MISLLLPGFWIMALKPESKGIRSYGTRIHRIKLKVKENEES